ncbi:MAG: hypothetical protein OZ928_11185, partial [Polyangiaceae bacterium]|nr:hypothetical protein [Polyangiaceae bacterium]
MGDAELLLQLRVLALELLDELVSLVRPHLRAPRYALEAGDAEPVARGTPRREVRAVDALAPQALADVAARRAPLGLVQDAELLLRGEPPALPPVVVER